MAKWRQAVELALSDEDIAKLTAISRSRTERGSRVDRARMLLAYYENPSFFAVGQAVEMRLTAYPGEMFRSTIRVKGLAFDAQTNLNPVWAEFDNPASGVQRQELGEHR